MTYSQKQAASLMCTCLDRMCDTLLFAAWYKWGEWMAALMQSGVVMLRCLNHISNRTCARAVLQWQQASAHNKRYQALLHASVVRMRKSLLWSGWQAWWEAIDDYYQLQHMLGTT